MASAQRHIASARRSAGAAAALTATAVAAALMTAGCTSIGPGTIERDRPAYGRNLAESWKDQMLLNVVKLRYADVPVFLDVATVINQYSLEGQLGVTSPGWDRPNSVGPPVGSVAGRWADRPTITYNPLTGDRFSRSLLSPIPPSAVMSLLQAGWPAEFVFTLAVRSINGIHNGSRTALFERERDPAFLRLTENLQLLQREVGLGVRVEKRPEGEAVLVVIPRQLEGPVATAQREVTQLLGLEPEAREFRLIYGATAGDGREVAMLTRSMLEILGEVSTFVELPAAHIAEGRAREVAPFAAHELPIRIHSGPSQPNDSYAAIEYRDHWYWIDDTDFKSKRIFTFLMIMLSLAETGGSQGAPLLTVNAGG
jgi:hypothetical protein